MEIIINFKDGTQAITDKWVKAENYYRAVMEDIATIFVKDEIVYNWSTGLDTFLSFTPPAMKKVGIKFNNGKPKMSILFKQFPKALEAVVRCAEFGHSKYNIDGCDDDHKNYKRVEGGYSVYEDAGIRHLMKQGVDDESGLPHLHHAVWNFLATLELRLDEDNQNSNK